MPGPSFAGTTKVNAIVSAQELSALDTLALTVICFPANPVVSRINESLLLTIVPKEADQVMLLISCGKAGICKPKPGCREHKALLIGRLSCVAGPVSSLAK